MCLSLLFTYPDTPVKILCSCRNLKNILLLSCMPHVTYWAEKNLSVPEGN